VGRCPIVVLARDTGLDTVVQLIRFGVADVIETPLPAMEVAARAHRQRESRRIDGLDPGRDRDRQGRRGTPDSRGLRAARPAVRPGRLRRERIRAQGRRAGSALRVHEVLTARPLASIPKLSSRTSLSFPAAAAGIELLVTIGIARELTGKRRNRIFVYDRYLAILNEGTAGA
jgi:hypothetical protein